MCCRSSGARSSAASTAWECEGKGERLRAGVQQLSSGCSGAAGRRIHRRSPVQGPHLAMPLAVRCQKLAVVHPSGC